MTDDKREWSNGLGCFFMALALVLVSLALNLVNVIGAIAAAACAR